MTNYFEAQAEVLSEMLQSPTTYEPIVGIAHIWRHSREAWTTDLVSAGLPVAYVEANRAAIDADHLMALIAEDEGVACSEMRSGLEAEPLLAMLTAGHVLVHIVAAREGITVEAAAVIVEADVTFTDLRVQAMAQAGSIMRRDVSDLFD